MKKDPATLPARFWSKVRKDSPCGCWLWTATVNSHGYGQIDDRHAHRIAYEFCVGPIPAGLFVCHKCDVRRCVNPDHLFLGDQGANMRDMVAKGRSHQTQKTHCKQGHEFTPENTYRRQNHRHCRACNRVHQARRAAADRKAA